MTDFKEKDRVFFVKRKQRVTGTIDELWTDAAGGVLATVVWDDTGCASDLPVRMLRKLEE